jgi:hypothetical protein
MSKQEAGAIQTPTRQCGQHEIKQLIPLVLPSSSSTLNLTVFRTITVAVNPAAILALDVFVVFDLAVALTHFCR